MQHTYYRITVPSLRADALRIAQISDVHFSRVTGQKKNLEIMKDLVKTVQLLRPDIIAVTGDLVSRNLGPTSLPDAAECLETLQNLAPVLYTFGNHEVDLPKEKRRLLLEHLRGTGVTMLNNSTVSFGGAEFSGFVLPQRCYKNTDGSYRDLHECTVNDIRRAMGSRGRETTILLAHSPMALPVYAKWGADVVLSGHVHGGIVRMPVIGGVLSPERKFFPKYTKGIYTKGKTTMVVSAGIGKLRVGNPPEVVCVDLVHG